MSPDRNFYEVLMKPEPFDLKVAALFLHALCLADTRGAVISAKRKFAEILGNASYTEPCVLQRVRLILEYYCSKNYVCTISAKPHIRPPPLLGRTPVKLIIQTKSFDFPKFPKFPKFQVKIL